MANRKLSSLSTTNVCRRDGDVLLRTNRLEDELHTRVPLLLKTKCTSMFSLFEGIKMVADRLYTILHNFKLV